MDDVDLAAAVATRPSWSVEGNAAVYAPPGANAQVRVQPVLLAQKHRERYVASVLENGSAVHTARHPDAGAAVRWAERTIS